jgi:hypothetical protein
MSEQNSTVIAPEDLIVLSETMVDLSLSIKQKKAELKKLSVTYKGISERVKEHMKTEQLKYIGCKGMQIHTYSRLREAPMDEQFIHKGLKEFYIKSNMGSQVTQATEKAAVFLCKRKKEKVDAKEVWTITLRALTDRKRSNRKRDHETMVDTEVSKTHHIQSKSQSRTSINESQSSEDHDYARRCTLINKQRVAL